MATPLLKTVADGVQLCAVQTDLFKTCKLSISMALPLSGDIAARAILPYLMRRACRKYPDFTALNGRLDELYGAVLGAGVSKKGEAQMLHLSLSSVDDRFSLDGESVSEAAAELLLDLLFDPKLENGTFCAEDVEQEKRLLLERMRSEDDDKRVYARKRCVEIMCADEAFGQNRFGTAEEISSLTPERVRAAWREVLETATIRAVLVSSGTADAVLRKLTDRFGGIERRVAPIHTQYIEKAAVVKTERETQPLRQGTLVMGFRCGMKNRRDMDPAMMLMCDIFGGGTYSKLFTVVREQMSLCYYCGAQLNRDKGVLYVAAGIDSDNEEKTKRAILDQLQAMQNGDFTEETFEIAKRSLCDTIRGYSDSPDVLCAWYDIQILDGTARPTAERIEEIRNARYEEIQNAAQHITLDTVFMLAGTEAQSDD